MKDNTDNTNNRKLLSILAHASILLGFSLISIVVPLAIMSSSEDNVVKKNAKESLNFFITSYILAIICIPLMFIIIGFPLFVLLVVATWVMPIIAIVKLVENPDRAYRYPLIFHML